VATDLAHFEQLAARHVAEVARELVRPSFGGPLSDHQWNSHTQVHTEDDVRAGAALAERFAAAFPGHGLIIEDREPVPGDGIHTWLIDPIDGSANHLRGIPYVSVTAGLVIAGEPVVGVVHDLMRDVTLSAHLGGGARVCDADGHTGPVSVSGTTQLIDAMLIAHLARKGPLIGVPDVLQHVLMSVRKIRCMGSIALDLALLAAGEADLLVVGRGCPQRMLDITGGMVVLREAGGVIVTADGLPVDESTRTLVAGPPALCERFVELVDGYALEAWTADQAVVPRRDLDTTPPHSMR
jgi:myo-inositol-1(or 4)-monophosphatase